MKTTHIIILLFLFSISLFAQEVEFTYVGNRENINTPLGVAETNDGFVILSKYKHDKTDYKLIKISSQGHLMDEQLILPEGYEETPEHFKITGITQSHPDTIYVLGSLPVDDDELGYYELYLACYDGNLNLLKSHRMLTLYLGVPNYGRAKINSKGNILFFGGMEVLQDMPGEQVTPFVSEITPQGDIKNLKLLRASYSQLCQSRIFDFKVSDIVEKPDKSGYTVINDGPLEEDPEILIKVPFVELDTLFNVTSYKKFFRDCYIAGTVFYDSDSTYILTGNSGFSHKSQNSSNQKNPPHYMLGVMKYDTANNKLKKLRFGSDSLYNYSGLFGSSAIDKVFPEYFYYSGTVNSRGSLIGLYNAPSHILVNKLDMDLNLKWQKTIGEDDDAYYLNYAAHATNDGGVLLLNHVYHYGSSSINLHVVKLKGSGDGIEENNTKQTSYHVYPNPGSDWLKVNIPKAYEETILQFTLHTLAGKTVYHENIQGNTPVNVSHLKDGMYIYTIRRNNTVLKSGKWVKN